MKSLTLLIKPASSMCNLRCKYCFYHDEAVNRKNYSMGLMEEQTAEVLIQKAFDAIETNGTVLFIFQGGEPTMAGISFFRYFVRKVHEKCPSTVQTMFSIQTNGTLLNEEWAVFFKQEQFLVGLSLDACPDIHDSLRIDAKGNGSWKSVLTAKDLLERYQVDYNVLCVVTAECAKQPARVYDNLKKMGFRYMQFIPCLDPIGKSRGNEEWSLKPGKYGQFLCKVFDLWYQDWQKGQFYSIRLFEDYIHTLLGENGSTCSTCGKCGSYLLIEGDGSCYPCDFYALDEWKLGNILEKSVSELVNCERAQQFLQYGTQKPVECAQCSYRPLCNGGCKNDWYIDASGTHNYFCIAFSMFFQKKIAKLEAITEMIRHTKKP